MLFQMTKHPPKNVKISEAIIHLNEKGGTWTEEREEHE